MLVWLYSNLVVWPILQSATRGKPRCLALLDRVSIRVDREQKEVHNDKDEWTLEFECFPDLSRDWDLCLFDAASHWLCSSDGKNGIEPAQVPDLFGRTAKLICNNNKAAALQCYSRIASKRKGQAAEYDCRMHTFVRYSERERNRFGFFGHSCMMKWHKHVHRCQILFYESP